MKLITYVIPTLNSAKTLDHTLFSLVTQTGVDLDIIVVDSYSTDATLDICKKWEVKVLYAKPGNMYHAINVGLSDCNTTWLGYLNSDDYLYSNSVIRLIQHGQYTKSDLVYGKCDYVDFQGRFMYSMNPPKPRWLKAMASTGSLGFAQQSCIFRRDLYQKLNGFDESFLFSSDFDFYLRALISDASFSLLTGPSVSCFRLHVNQLSQKKAHLMVEEGEKIRNKLESREKILDSLLRLIWKIGNIFNYIVRIIRQSYLADRLVILRSIHGGKHKE
jgi:glycosyltransferase involved in cell wall biosynthesis